MLAIDNLVITGSNGFVGQCLLDYFEAQEYSNRPGKIVTLNRTDNSKKVLSRYPNLNIEYHIADLSKPWTLEISDAFLINLAADGSENAYTENASKLFIQIGAQCADWILHNKPKGVFHASSGAAYGIEALNISNIEQSSNKISTLKDSFIKSRLAVEDSLSIVAKKISNQITVGRLFSFVGPNILNKRQYAVSDFIHSAIEHGEIIVNGNPNTVRSYLHESDLSEWIVKSLFVNYPSSPISIGSSISVRISELAEFIASATGAQVTYLNPNAPGDAYVPDNVSTLERLGVSESKNWQDAVIECIEIAREFRN